MMFTYFLRHRLTNREGAFCECVCMLLASYCRGRNTIFPLCYPASFPPLPWFLAESYITRTPPPPKFINMYTSCAHQKKLVTQKVT